jgi:tetratricopeptide (TPR) repeat protein
MIVEDSEVSLTIHLKERAMKKVISIVFCVLVLFSFVPLARSATAKDAERYFKSGFGYYQQHEYSSAITKLDKALEIYTELGDDESIAFCKNLIGLSYSYTGDAKEGLTYQNEALTINRKMGNKGGEGSRGGEGYTLNNIGLTYSFLGNYETALKYYDESLVLLQENGPRWLECVALANAGDAFIALEKNAEATTYLNKALVIADELGEGGLKDWIVSDLDSIGVKPDTDNTVSPPDLENEALSYQEYEGEHCIIKYMSGVSLEKAKEAAAAYETAYVEVGKDLGGYYPKKLNIYLYKNQTTLVAGLVLYSHFTSSHAHDFDSGGSPRPLQNILHVNIDCDLQEYISHEYTHTVIEELYDTTYLRIKWLDEGMAQYEGYKIAYDPDMRKMPVWRTIKANIKWGKFIPLNELTTDEQFWNYRQKGNWGYEESAAVVFFIKEVYGFETAQKIFKNMLMGMTSKNAVESAVGKDLSEFEKGFIEYVKSN